MAHRAELEASRKTYNLRCVIAQTLDVVGDRWTLLILRDLMAGLHRYNDTSRAARACPPTSFRTA